MRLVDADDAVNRFEELKPKGSSLDVRYAYGVSVGLEMAKHVIMSELSTVDVVPVRHGRWIPVDSYSAFGGDESTWMAHGNPIAYYYCSECKEQTYAGEDGEPLLTKYCPDCGAKMDGKDGDGNG